MRYRQLECFVRVCDLGSITRASDQLNIAQPALGLQMRGLEHEFGVQLLVRNSRGVHPTEAGLVLLEKARSALLEMRELKARLRQFADGREELTLGLSPSMTAMIAGEVLAAARAELPRLHLCLLEDMSHVLVDRVLTSDIDLALAYDVGPRDALERTPLGREELFMVQPPGMGGDGPLTLADALAMPLAIPGSRDTVRRAVEETARQSGLPLQVSYELQSITAIRDLVRSGAASTILPLGTVYREAKAGEVVVRRIIDPPIFRTLYLTRIAARGVPAIERDLTGLLRRIIAALGQDRGSRITFFFPPGAARHRAA